MRLFASIGLGVLLSAAGAYSQALSEHAAAAAGATIGSAAGKPMSNALSGILGQVDQSTAAAAQTGAKAAKVMIPPGQQTPQDKAAQTNRAGGPGSFSPGFSGGGSSSGGAYTADQPVARRRSAPLRAMPQPVSAPAPAAEPVKEPSLEEVASVKLGTTEKDLFNSLGQPESRVVVPDDDGHMRESCQYWANGKQLGTIRLDNGQVVRVEIRVHN